MNTLNKITFDIMELLRGNQISDDTEIDQRQVIYHVNNQRALWLRNEYNKPGRTIDPNVEQDLGCINLIEVDAAECCDFETDCIVLRTETKIPTTIELHSAPAITRVGPVNKTSISFNFIPNARIPYIGTGKYSGGAVSAFLLNNYIYIMSKDLGKLMMDSINIRGIFEDPTEAANYVDCDNVPCYTNDSNYPLNSWMIPYIKEQVLKQFGMAIQIPKDESNSAEENITVRK